MILIFTFALPSPARSLLSSSLFFTIFIFPVLIGIGLLLLLLFKSLSAAPLIASNYDFQRCRFLGRSSS